MSEPARAFDGGPPNAPAPAGPSSAKSISTHRPERVAPAAIVEVEGEVQAAIPVARLPVPAPGRWRLWAWLLGVGAPLLAINLVALPYYTAPMAVRVRHPWHAMLRPSGTVGLAAGVVAVAIFIFLWLYPLRKKYRRLAFLGSLGKWMDVHVASALALPLLLAIHSAWRADGLIGLGLLAMLVVIASGVVGRYLYVRIPRARNGVELTREEVANRRRELIGSLALTTGLGVDVVERTLDVTPEPAEQQGILRTFGRLLADDVLRTRRTAELRRRWADVAPSGQPLSRAALADAVSIASQEISLVQQARMLSATQRVFRFWHIAHRPFAITALIAVVIHIAVVIAVGVVGI
jgi:hypothetical protein